MAVDAPDRVDELERALEGPPARRGDPFVHTFRIRWWRVLSRHPIRAGDVALCGYVARRSHPAVRVGSGPLPRCPRCEALRPT